nr:hypothetical protein [Proteus sp. G4445]
MLGVNAVVEHIESKTIDITQDEVNALKKLIMYVKFSCEENESLQYASSYSINSFFDKLIDIDCFGKAAKEFYSKRNINNENSITKKINDDQEKSINKMDESVLQEVFKEALHPFKIK